MITHSLGELDVLFPLFTEVKVKYDVDVKMIFTVNKIYQQFKSNEFYQYCARKLDIKIIKCQLPNKFDYRGGFFYTRIGALIIKIYFEILKIIKYPFLLPKLYWADAYMHESSNQRRSTFLLYKLSDLLSKNIFVYHHGHALTQVIKYSKKVHDSEKATLLLFHELTEDWGESAGFQKINNIGWPKLYESWKKIINEYKGENNFNKHIVIFSRQAGHPYYMDEEKYNELLIESYECLRKFYPNNKIIIKPHPREDIGFIKWIIKKNKMKNIIISNNHSAILCKNAIMAISFWTSCVFDSLSVGIPTIEFYKEADKFREQEPKGSLYKLIGIDSTENKLELINFIKNVKNNEYILPPVIEDFAKVCDVSFIDF